MDRLTKRRILSRSKRRKLVSQKDSVTSQKPHRCANPKSHTAYGTSKYGLCIIYCMRACKNSAMCYSLSEYRNITAQAKFNATGKRGLPCSDF